MLDADNVASFRCHQVKSSHQDERIGQAVKRVKCSISNSANLFLTIQSRASCIGVSYLRAFTNCLGEVVHGQKKVVEWAQFITKSVSFGEGNI